MLRDGLLSALPANQTSPNQPLDLRSIRGFINLKILLFLSGWMAFLFLYPVACLLH
jgi:hypothetical protein